jgi:hypothetical protein
MCFAFSNEGLIFKCGPDCRKRSELSVSLYEFISIVMYVAALRVSITWSLVLAAHCLEGIGHGVMAGITLKVSSVHRGRQGKLLTGEAGAEMLNLCEISGEFHDQGDNV